MCNWSSNMKTDWWFGSDKSRCLLALIRAVDTLAVGVSYTKSQSSFSGTTIQSSSFSSRLWSASTILFQRPAFLSGTTTHSSCCSCLRPLWTTLFQRAGLLGRHLLQGRHALLMVLVVMLLVVCVTDMSLLVEYKTLNGYRQEGFSLYRGDLNKLPPISARWLVNFDLF